MMCVEKILICQCGTCSQDFCYNDFENNRQELSKQLEVTIQQDLILPVNNSYVSKYTVR